MGLPSGTLSTASCNRIGEDVLHSGVAGRAALVNMIDGVAESSFDR